MNVCVLISVSCSAESVLLQRGLLVCDRPPAPADLFPDRHVYGDVAHGGGSHHHQPLPLHPRLQRPEAILRGLCTDEGSVGGWGWG